MTWKNRIQADHGSVLPLFLFGIALTLVAATAVVSATGLFAQQRRLNGVSDSVALATAAAMAADPNLDLGGYAREALTVLNGSVGQWLDRAEQVEDRVVVRLCQRNQLVITAVFSGGRICATSAAKAVT